MESGDGRLDRDSDPVHLPERANAATDPGSAGLSIETVPQLPRARRKRRQARAGSRRGCRQIDWGSTRTAGATRRRKYARVWKESESGGDYGAGGISRDASSFAPGSGPGRFPLQPEPSHDGRSRGIWRALCSWLVLPWEGICRTRFRPGVSRLLQGALRRCGLRLRRRSPTSIIIYLPLTWCSIFLLMVLAAPLILLGAPAIVLMHGLPQRLVRGAVTPFRRPGGLRLLGTVCTHPAFCWLAGSVTVIVWHVPAVFELALHSHNWHEFEHASFFMAGILFWWPVIQPWPSIANSLSWSIPVYLFLATLAVRRAFGIPDVLRPRGVPRILVGTGGPSASRLWKTRRWPGRSCGSRRRSPI